jgi:hypothetical protein
MASGRWFGNAIWRSRQEARSEKRLHELERMIRNQLKGDVRFDWRSEGLVCEIAVPELNSADPDAGDNEPRSALGE